MPRPETEFDGTVRIVLYESGEHHIPEAARKHLPRYPLGSATLLGRLAVIGPTRMDYQHTINAVSYLARMFDKLFNEPE